MKKYSKMITLLLVLAMVFTLFTGFTYAPVDVDNLAIVECPMCYGNGRCNIGICDGTSSCTADSCGACLGTHICPECNGTGTVVESTTPTPTPTPSSTKCTVNGAMHINNDAYEIDINNYVGDNLKLEFLATSSKGHTLVYSWKNNDVTIVGANTNTYTDISNVLGNHKYKATATCATCSVGSSSYTNVNTIAKPIVKPTLTPTPDNSQKIEISAYNSKEILNNKTKFLFSLNVRDNITLGELKEEYLNDNLPKYNNFAIKTFLSSTYFTIIDDDFVIKKDALLDDYVGFVLFIGVDDIDKIDGNVSEDGSGGEIVQAEYVTVTYMDDSKIYKTTKVISSKINETQYLINPPFSLDGSKTFKGWGMSASAKNVITADWKPTEDTILYSIYEIKESGVESFGKKVIGILIVAGVIVLLVVIIKTVNSGFVNNAYKGGKSRLEYKEYKKNTKKNKK